ncbi:MAG: PEP-CTERM sorting domain-containing protein [Chthoniobacterales bacterium]
MKTSPFLATLSAALLLTVAAHHTQAGTLTIGNGPSFHLPGSFTDNSIDATLLHNPGGLNGDVVRLFGDSMVAQVEGQGAGFQLGTAHERASEAPHINIGGNFSANANDLFSVVYDFDVDLNSPTPITITLGAKIIMGGVTQNFETLIVIMPGNGHYQGTINGPLFSLATSGMWRGFMIFNLDAPDDGSSTNRHVGDADLIVSLHPVDFRLVAVPEPSSIVSLALGVALLGGFALRRRLAA